MDHHRSGVCRTWSSSPNNFCLLSLYRNHEPALNMHELCLNQWIWNLECPHTKPSYIIQLLHFEARSFQIQGFCRILKFDPQKYSSYFPLQTTAHRWSFWCRRCVSLWCSPNVVGSGNWRLEMGPSRPAAPKSRLNTCSDGLKWWGQHHSFQDPESWKWELTMI